MVKAIAHDESDGIASRGSNHARIFVECNFVSIFQQSVVADQSTIREGGGKQGSPRQDKPKVRTARRARVKSTGALCNLRADPAMSSSNNSLGGLDRANSS